MRITKASSSPLLSSALHHPACSALSDHLRRRDFDAVPDKRQFGRFPVRQCRMILSRGSAAPRPFVWPARAVEVRLPSFSSSLFMWPCVNETSLQLLWCDLVISPRYPVARALTGGVSRVFDTIGQLFHRAGLCADGRLQHCEEQWLLLPGIKEVSERVFMILQDAAAEMSESCWADGSSQARKVQIK